MDTDDVVEANGEFSVESNICSPCGIKVFKQPYNFCTWKYVAKIERIAPSGVYHNDIRFQTLALMFEQGLHDIRPTAHRCIIIPG